MIGFSGSKIWHRPSMLCWSFQGQHIWVLLFSCSKLFFDEEMLFVPSKLTQQRYMFLCPKRTTGKHMLYPLSKLKYMGTTVSLLKSMQRRPMSFLLSKSAYMSTSVSVVQNRDKLVECVRLLSHVIHQIGTSVSLLKKVPAMYLLSKSTYMSSSVSLVQLHLGHFMVCVFCPRIYVKTVLLLLCSK